MLGMRSRNILNWIFLLGLLIIYLKILLMWIILKFRSLKHQLIIIIALLLRKSIHFVVIDLEQLKRIFKC